MRVLLHVGTCLAEYGITSSLCWFMNVSKQTLGRCNWPIIWKA